MPSPSVLETSRPKALSSLCVWRKPRLAVALSGASRFERPRIEGISVLLILVGIGEMSMASCLEGTVVRSSRSNSSNVGVPGLEPTEMEANDMSRSSDRKLSSSILLGIGLEARLNRTGSSRAGEELGA